MRTGSLNPCPSSHQSSAHRRDRISGPSPCRDTVPGRVGLGSNDNRTKSSGGSRGSAVCNPPGVMNRSPRAPARGRARRSCPDRHPPRAIITCSRILEVYVRGVCSASGAEAGGAGMVHQPLRGSRRVCLGRGALAGMPGLSGGVSGGQAPRGADSGRALSHSRTTEGSQHSPGPRRQTDAPASPVRAGATTRCSG